MLGPGFAICAAAHGELESSGNLSALAAGDASLAWDGAHPIPTVPLDADLGLSAILGLSQIGMPGAHQVVRRCVREAGDMGVVGGAVDTAPPEVSRPGLPARAPGESSIPLQRNPASGDQTRAGAAPASSGEAAGGSSGEVAGEAGQNQQAHEPARETTSNAVIDSSGPGSGPAPLGSVIGILLAAGAAMVVPSVIAFALQNRKGQKWVRANVRAVSSAPPAVGIQMTPQADYPWPTFGVQLALRPDSGTQSFMEVKQ